ncbi:MAG: ABC transporter permease subunit [Oscillospiraceae bacterium]|jgi:L-cystine transport system permease protein|nr:ABC transporter permease subunit [Oscillospiraceae bacterium]
MSFSFLLTALWAAAQKIPTTLVLAVAPFLIGALVGLPLALARFFRVPVLRRVLNVGVNIIKGVPVALMLMVFYVLCSSFFDPVMQQLHLPFAFRDFNKALIAIAALSVYAAAALSEVFRGALAAVRKGQYDASYAAGLSNAQALRRVILPQALPASLPMACNIFIALIKAAAMASLISVIDVMNAAVNAAGGNYRYLEAYIAAALVYWGLCIAAERLFRLAERKVLLA